MVFGGDHRQGVRLVAIALVILLGDFAEDSGEPAFGVAFLFQIAGGQQGLADLGAAQGGLDYWQMMEIFEAIAARAPICGFNMVELMPSRDVNGQGALMASRLGLSMLGLMAAQVAAGR